MEGLCFSLLLAPFVFFLARLIRRDDLASIAEQFRMLRRSLLPSKHEKQARLESGLDKAKAENLGADNLWVQIFLAFGGVFALMFLVIDFLDRFLEAKNTTPENMHDSNAAQSLYQEYSAFQLKRGRPPQNEAEFREFVRKHNPIADLARLRLFRVNWSARAGDEHPKAVLAVCRQTDWVVYSNGTVGTD